MGSRSSANRLKQRPYELVFALLSQMTMNAKHSVFVAAIVCGVASIAHADATGQGGVVGTVSYELDSERVTGGGVAVFGDLVGIGMLLGLDYQNVPKREEGAVLHGHTVAFGMGFRFSPISMMNNPRLLHHFDLYAVAGVQGGVAYRNGRFGQRSSTYTAVGAEIRAGNGRPGVVIEHQWRSINEDEPEVFQQGSAVIVGLSFTGAAKGPVRD